MISIGADVGPIRSEATSNRSSFFLLIIRPNEVIPKITYSEKQWAKIGAFYKKNVERAHDSMTLKAFESDEILKIIKEKQKKRSKLIISNK